MPIFFLGDINLLTKKLGEGGGFPDERVHHKHVCNILQKKKTKQKTHTTMAAH